MLQLIIFDMDGVIADTEYHDFLQQQNFVKTLSANPDALTHEDFSSLAGKSYGNLYRAIKTLTASPLSEDEIGAALADYAAEHYETPDYKALFRKDIVHILDYAAQHGIKLAVASSSRRSRIMELLETCDIADKFDHIASGEDFAESKPNPEIYLSVLTALNIDAAHAAAVEDSESGIAAAKAAGIFTIAYEETRMTMNQSRADAKGGNMIEILEILKQRHEAA